MSGLAAAHILVCWVVQLPIAVSDLERKTRIMGISRTDAIFIYARTAGLIAHHLEQQRLDEGLFRLPNDLIGSFEE